MKKLLFLVFCLVVSNSILAQSTSGNKSPILIGSKEKINYVKEQVINQKIPAELIPYLSGLIFSNTQIGSNKSNINEALTVWFKKYNNVKASIDKISDFNTKKLAIKSLAEGNFGAVEELTKIKSNYQELIKTFPKSYQTSGDNSPIIIGDYGTVTYVVKEIINYQLPEGLTLNLVNELRSKDKLIGNQATKLGDLTKSVANKEAIVKDYINRYNAIKEQLRISPLEVYKSAYNFFVNGDYDGALKILEKSTGNDKSLGESRMIKARILLLQLNTSKIDATLAEIDKCYNLGITLSPSAENYFEYGKFLIDYPGNYIGAISILEKADLLTTDKIKKINIYNYLGIAYSATDRIKTNSIHEKAIQLLDEMEPLTDKSLITLKAQLYANIGYGYATRFFNVNDIKTGISFSEKAIAEIDKMHSDVEEDKFKKARFLNQLGQQYALIADTIKSMESYKRALTFFEKEYANKPDVYAISLTGVYANMAELYFNTARPSMAVPLLNKSIAIVEPKISIDNRIYLFAYEQLYTALLKNYVAMNMGGDILKNLLKMRRMLEPFLIEDPKTFAIHKAWVDTDLGEAYLFKKQLDSATIYMEPAYKYYAENMNALQFDKMKAGKCLYQMNEIWIQLGQSDKAIEANNNFLEKLKDAVAINRFAYEDFIPQIERQLARIYTTLGLKEKALEHMEAALIIVEPKAKQYGSSYLESYNNYMIQYFLLNLAFADFDKADEVVTRFKSGCITILEVDPFVKANMQATIGDCISNFSVQLFSYTQIQPNTLSPGNLEKLFTMGQKYFDDSDSYYATAISQKPTDGIKYAITLSNAIFLQNFWMNLLADNNQRDAHKNKKCALATKSKNILANLGSNSYTSGIIEKIQFLTSDCK